MWTRFRTPDAFCCSIASGRVKVRKVRYLLLCMVNSQLFVIYSYQVISSGIVFLLVEEQCLEAHVPLFVLISFLHLIYLVDLSLSG